MNSAINTAVAVTNIWVVFFFAKIRKRVALSGGQRKYNAKQAASVIAKAMNIFKVIGILAYGILESSLTAVDINALTA